MSEANGVCGYLGWSLPFDGGCCSLSPLRASGPAATFWTGEQKRTASGQEPKGFGTLEEDLDCGGILCLNDSLRGDATPPRTSRSVILRARPKVILSASVSQTKTDQKGPRLRPLRFRLGWNRCGLLLSWTTHQAQGGLKKQCRSVRR